MTVSEELSHELDKVDRSDADELVRDWWCPRIRALISERDEFKRAWQHASEHASEAIRNMGRERTQRKAAENERSTLSKRWLAIGMWITLIDVTKVVGLTTDNERDMYLLALNDTLSKMRELEGQR